MGVSGKAGETYLYWHVYESKSIGHSCMPGADPPPKWFEISQLPSVHGGLMSGIIHITLVYKRFFELSGGVVWKAEADQK